MLKSMAHSCHQEDNEKIALFVLGYRHSSKLMHEEAAHKFTYYSFIEELIITHGL